MMRFFRQLGCGLFLTAALLPQTEPNLGIGPIEGRFVLLAAGSDNVPRTIDKGTETLSFWIRPFARSLLRKRNISPPTLQIEVSSGSVRIERQGVAPTSGTLDGKVATWKTADGEATELRYVVRKSPSGAVLEESFVAKYGTRTNQFVWDEKDRVLRQSVILESPRLPKPIRYGLVYERSR